MIRHALRHVLSGIGVIVVLAVGVASLAAGTATAAIKSTIKQMFVILNDEELKTPGRAEWAWFTKPFSPTSRTLPGARSMPADRCEWWKPRVPRS